ncbi:MAG: TetR/AcrR family transcriptional regulator [Bacteroidota bacterium]
MKTDLKENSDKQRNRIACAFEKHFLHFGFKKTTVDDVAEELGVSKKTIYRLFRSKEDIFSFIISRKAESRRAMVEKEIMHIGTASGKLEAMIRINFSEYRKVRKKKAGALDDGFQTEIASRIFRKTFFSMLSDILKRGIENKEFEVCDHEMTVRYIQALIGETIMSVRENSESRPENFLICTVNKMLGKSI